MTTPLILLALLLGPWAFRSALGASQQQREQAGRHGIALMFLFTGVGHFTSPDTMLALIPPAMPLRALAVYVSGLIEIALALAVTRPGTRVRAGQALLVLLVALLPFNLWGALNHVDSGGHAWGPGYLLIRVPLQLIMLAWVYRFAVAAR